MNDSLKITFQNFDEVLDLSSPIVMGIVNITPDSFFDGGTLQTENDLLNRVEQMLYQGASIIDIGAVSTRPGAADVSESEELQRLIPALEGIVKNFPQACISVDTFRSNVAQKAIETGAHMINDITGGNGEQNMFNTISRLKVPYILMHMQGTPANMQTNPEYSDVVAEIFEFFQNQINKLNALGVKNNIILDPGFGFGKTVEHNYQILKSLQQFTQTGYPVLAGISRKSMINRVLNSKPENAMNGTTALHVIALMNGASILRVHDVKEAMEAIKLVEFYKNV